MYILFLPRVGLYVSKFYPERYYFDSNMKKLVKYRYKLSMTS